MLETYSQYGKALTMANFNAIEPHVEISIDRTSINIRSLPEDVSQPHSDNELPDIVDTTAILK